MAAMASPFLHRSIVYQHPNFSSRNLHNWTHVLIVGVGGYGDRDSNGNWTPSAHCSSLPEATSSALTLARFWVELAVRQARPGYHLSSVERPVGTIALLASAPDGSEVSFCVGQKVATQFRGAGVAMPADEIVLLPATRVNVAEAIEEWDDRLRSATTTAVLHWVGHGGQKGDRQNPTQQVLFLEDVKHRGNRRREYQDGFSVDSLKKYMEFYTDSESQYFFIDACYDVTLSRPYSRIIQPANQRSFSRPRQWSFHSAEPGQQAYAYGKRTGFTQAVIEALLWYGGSPTGGGAGRAWPVANDTDVEEALRAVLSRWRWEHGVDPAPQHGHARRTIVIWRGLGTGGTQHPLRFIDNPRMPLFVVTRESHGVPFALTGSKGNLPVRRAFDRRHRTPVPLLLSNVPVTENHLLLMYGSSTQPIMLYGRPCCCDLI